MIKTLQVKLHNLSNYKTLILNKTMKNYSLAYKEMLQVAKENIDIITEKYCDDKGEYKARTISSFFSGMNIHTKYGLEKLYDGLKTDVSGNIASYLELKKEDDNNTNYPTIKASKLNIIKKIKKINDKILNDTDITDEECNNLEQNIKKYEKKLNKSKKYKPISFCRYEEKRDCCLLYNPITNKYFAKLYLLNDSDSKTMFKNRPKLKRTTYNENHQLYYIPSMNKFKEDIKKPQSFILVPLEFGRWHEKWFKKIRRYEVKTCPFKLIKRNNEFYLDIPIEDEIVKCTECNGYLNKRGICVKCGKKFESKEVGKIKKETFVKTYKPETKLGIDLGISNIATITVLDNKNNLLFTKRYDGEEYCKKIEHYVLKMSQAQRNAAALPQDKKYLEGFLHTVANDIIKIAREYKSQVYMEDLKMDKSKKKLEEHKKFKMFSKKAKKKVIERINRWSYGQMIDIMEYKCSINKIPKPKLINPKFTSEKCHVCGHNEVISSKGKDKNRESQDSFICKKCGLTMNADENASINIACYYDSKITLKLEEKDGLYTVKNKLFKFNIQEKTPEDTLKKWLECLKEYKQEYDNIPWDKKKKGSKLAKQYAVLKHLEKDNYKEYFIIEL